MSGPILSVAMNKGYKSPVPSSRAVVFDTVNVDVNKGFNLTTGIYTVPIDGYYTVTYSVSTQAITAPVNALPALVLLSAAAKAAAGANASRSVVNWANATDVVKNDTYYTSASTLDIILREGDELSVLLRTFGYDSVSGAQIVQSAGIQIEVLSLAYFQLRCLGPVPASP